MGSMEGSSMVDNRGDMLGRSTIKSIMVHEELYMLKEQHGGLQRWHVREEHDKEQYGG